MKIYAPFAGSVRYCVARGQRVATGDELAVVEAVKLEAPVLAPGPGLVESLSVAPYSNVAGGDELLQFGEA